MSLYACLAVFDRLPEVLPTIGANAVIVGINPLEPHSSMNVKDVRAKYEKLVLWGGVDNSFMLVQGTPDDVRRRVEELKEFGKDGGMLIGSTGQIHPACKLENLLAMIETAHARKTKTQRIQTIPPKRIREMDHEVLR